MRGCHRHSLGHACWVASDPGAWYPSLHAANPPTFKASVCRERTSGPALHADTAPTEEPPWSRARSLTLHASRSLDPWPSPAFTQPRAQTKPLSRGAKPSPRWPWPAVLGGAQQAVVAAEPALCRLVAGSQVGTGVHLVSVCGHALRARNASWVSSGRLQSSGLSKQVDRSR